VPVKPAAVELLIAARPVLERWGAWYVFGAQAVIMYGVPRLTADVDVTLALRPDAPERFVHDMEAAGFGLRVGDTNFVRQSRVMPFVHERTGVPLDVVFAGSGLEDEILSRVALTDVGGTTVPVIDLSDLIITKVLAGRPKDLEDVRTLWRIHETKVDAGRIRDVLGLLEQALGQSDLLPAFEAIVHQSPR
jgi:hypothetical protein